MASTAGLANRLMAQVKEQDMKTLKNMIMVALPFAYFAAAALIIAYITGCSIVTRTITDPVTGIVEYTESKQLFRKGAITIKDSNGSGGVMVTTDQTIDADIITSTGTAIKDK